tara:strand:+ start:17958 stop:20453 length:2496 start_codon:yes stop_codon:yes gene_type:complete
MAVKYFLLILLFPLIVSSQEKIVVDGERNPISNVSAFNSLKTKSALSNNDGIINLSRFLYNDTIIFQHPGYKTKKIVKKNINEYLLMELDYQLLDNIIIAETKNNNNIKNSAEKKIYISSDEIKEITGTTTADLLEKKGGVSVQRSQMGGGSPNIRGFEANRVLLMIDGVRLNNAIYRSGHLQNIITIDEFMLNDIEVVFGPSSVIYGSDAIGGTIHMKTKELYFTNHSVWSGESFSSYNSSSRGLKKNINISFESSNYSYITSFSFKNFGDLQMGSFRPHGYKNWGLVNHYIDPDGSIVCNPNPETQIGTGYKQYDFFHKGILKTSDNSRLTANIQYSTSSNISRFDQLNDGDGECVFENGICLGGDDLKFHSYYYGPQKRFLGSLTFSLFGQYFDKADIIASYQKVKESRHKWKLEDYLNFNPEEDKGSELDMINQFESVDVYGLNINLRRGNFFIGSETSYNNVVSESSSNRNSAAIEDTRYPSEGSGLFSTAFYANVLKRFSHKFQVETGLRFTISKINGNYPDITDAGGEDLFNLLSESTSVSNSVLSGNLKLVYFPNDSWKISSVTSRGFHAPNVDDMFKVFRKGDIVTVPYKELRPEYSLTQEISVTKEVSDNLTLYGLGYFTRLSSAIIKDTLFMDLNPEPNEEYLVSTMVYDGEILTTFANQNADEAINIYGFTLGFQSTIFGFNINKDINIINYKNSNLNAGPFAHIPPLFGKLEVAKHYNLWSARFLCLYSGAKNANTFDNGGTDNLDETPVIGEDEIGNTLYAGLPAWYTLNFSIKYNFLDKSSILLGIDNILDAHYKTFGSGLSAPGRSIIFSLHHKF